MNDIYSFYQLISKYQIEIPIIQRDYAQGRKNSKAADVRKSLVDNMIKAAKEDKPLFFDFVYGRVDNNKFIPFDGQQRLTTLFLFHKYVFEKCQADSDCDHKDYCSCRGILGRFSYATRQSSREFCKKLVENNIIPDDKYKNQLRETFIAALKKEDNEKEKKADEFIKSIDNWIYRFVTNQSWFYPDWEKDPTVMGMLTMLDEIHCQMRNETDFKTFAEKLTSGCNCPITFHFVDMGEHKMSDETYVKMNARGKTLTPFENFKASLEQYLEEKSKSENLSVELKGKYSVLLCRLKGEYDEELQKYTGIDGTWLDLFWKVANKDKKEKDLPDTLMMSFFNRHFMNVWRCWYANNSKSENKEEYDAFNTRIQEEMPLYPTKDNFVSFDIYRKVMEVCGIEKCLTPIFNIYDKLCDNDNNIENDCQAVWNRSGDSNGEKWDLFQKNVNDETYKSRTAFYALLKYYDNSNNGNNTTSEHEKDKPTLKQWMRIAWNIIENYVEREESYIPALLLIESIAENSFDIIRLNNYNGVAKDQMEEEIAKAKQILNGEQRSDGKTWEEIIIEAENYAFFKGAIRFLFTDGEGNVNWKDFDKKFKNAKRYFTDAGVTKEYRKSALLLRALLSRIDIGNRAFGNYADFWHETLLDKQFQPVIHYLLAASELQLNENCDDWISDIHLLELLLEEKDGWYLLKDWRGHDVITRYSKRVAYPTKNAFNEIVVLNSRRNKILQTKEISVQEDQRIKDTSYLYGWNINFSYEYKDKMYYFQWLGNPNETECDVYLMEEEWVDYVKRPDYKEGKPDKENFYCFEVTSEMEENTTQFTEELKRLIEESHK